MTGVVGVFLDALMALTANWSVSFPHPPNAESSLMSFQPYVRENFTHC
jgi:hypothetical protein